MEKIGKSNKNSIHKLIIFVPPFKDLILNLLHNWLSYFVGKKSKRIKTFNEENYNYK